MKFSVWSGIKSKDVIVVISSASEHTIYFICIETRNDMWKLRASRLYENKNTIVSILSVDLHDHSFVHNEFCNRAQCTVSLFLISIHQE